MRVKQYLAFILAIGFAIYLGWRKNPAENFPTHAPAQIPKMTLPTDTVHLSVGHRPSATLTTIPIIPRPPSTALAPANKKKEPVFHYRLEEGLAVIQGDIVVGQLNSKEAPETGLVQLLPMKTWTGRIIPFFIAPDIINPDRVKQALALFDGTAVRFVPFTDQEDALVFVVGAEHCKSYVGRIGGKQPIWLSPECGPTEIAHEVMHALGFVHEQNRSDRDDFIQVNFDNIDENYRDNFEKLPAEFMTVSGLAPFDFESIMIYPVWMFVKGGQATMESKIKDRQIQPDVRPSKGDVDRINLEFGH